MVRFSFILRSCLLSTADNTLVSAEPRLSQWRPTGFGGRDDGACLDCEKTGPIVYSSYMVLYSGSWFADHCSPTTVPNPALRRASVVAKMVITYVILIL
jgi:hypothetical protein